MLVAITAFAAPLPASVGTLQPVGGGTFTYLFWTIYDAKLFAPGGRYQPDGPFALQLTYRREIKGSEIAKTSISEMERQGWDDPAQLAQWQQDMDRIFPDVQPGTVLTGVRTDSGYARFYQGDKLLGEISDRDFATAFFNIWLSPSTRDPAFRRKLLGQ